MNRIDAAFARARAEGRAALLTYVCAGDPTLASTERLVPALAAAGADLIELGVPFSDPIADGPTIQAAAARALASGTTLGGVLGLVERLRSGGLDCPLVLMSYLSPLWAMGLPTFVARAAQAGVDGLIVPDLPLEEAGPLQAECAARGLCLSLLAAPTTPEERLSAIGQRTRGFLYFVSVTGVTGARSALPEALPSQLARARSHSTAPVAVGFGVTTPEQAAHLAQHADGVIVGSALVKALEASGGEPPPGPGIALVRALAEALRTVQRRSS